MGNLFIGFPVPRAKIADMITGAAPPTIHHTQHEENGKDVLDGTKIPGAGGRKVLFTDIFISGFFEGSAGYEPWASLSGSSSVGESGLRLSTGTTANSVAKCGKVIWPIFPTFTWDKNRQLDIHTYLKSTISKIGLFWLISGDIDTDEHIGFKIVDGVLYGTVADNATEATLNIMTIGTGAWNTRLSLSVKFEPTAQAEFFVNGVSKGILTTNLPSGIGEAEQILQLYVKNTGVAEDKVLNPTHWQFWQEG
jgi:hypothetical protein